MHFKINVDDQGCAQAAIGPSPDKGMTFSLTLTQITEFIRTLGQARAKMESFLPEPVLRAEDDILSVRDPQFYVEKQNDQSTLIVFHHPGFGGLGFELQPDEVARFARVLSLA